MRRRTKTALFAAGGTIVEIGLLFNAWRVVEDAAGYVAAPETPALQRQIQDAALDERRPTDRPS